MLFLNVLWHLNGHLKLLSVSGSCHLQTTFDSDTTVARRVTAVAVVVHSTRDRPRGHGFRQRSGVTTHRDSDRRVFRRHHQPVPGSAPLDSRFVVQLPRSTVRSVVHPVTRFTDIRADIRLQVVRGRLLPVRLLPEPDRRHRTLTLNDDRRLTRDCSIQSSTVRSRPLR